ncbi:hypothetical protein [Micrococcoides hystricis]|uniref:ATP synthase protein I n=1 Tax=Micrococcoides hystricis TaxID=1572761 RepID=A0ABV6PBS5_9MICC
MNITVNDLMWRKVAFACVNAMSWLVIGFGTAGILYADWHAALSAVGTIVIVAFFSWISVALTDVTSRRAPGIVMVVAMAGFVLKLVAFALILTLFDAPFWLRPEWAATAAIAAIILWQVVEVIVFIRHRHRIYD